MPFLPLVFYSLTLEDLSAVRCTCRAMRFARLRSSILHAGQANHDFEYAAVETLTINVPQLSAEFPLYFNVRDLTLLFCRHRRFQKLPLPRRLESLQVAHLRCACETSAFPLLELFDAPLEGLRGLEVASWGLPLCDWSMLRSLETLRLRVDLTQGDVDQLAQLAKLRCLALLVNVKHDYRVLRRLPLLAELGFEVRNDGSRALRKAERFPVIDLRALRLSSFQCAHSAVQLLLNNCALVRAGFDSEEVWRVSSFDKADLQVLQLRDASHALPHLPRVHTLSLTKFSGVVLHALGAKCPALTELNLAAANISLAQVVEARTLQRLSVHGAINCCDLPLLRKLPRLEVFRSKQMSPVNLESIGWHPWLSVVEVHAGAKGSLVRLVRDSPRLAVIRGARYDKALACLLAARRRKFQL